MNKPNQLRAYLAERIPALKAEPERLKMFVDQGRVMATAGQRGVMGFVYSYTLQLILLDWAQHPDVVVIPVLAWLEANQRDLVQGWAGKGDAGGLPFEVEILDNDKVDLSFEIALSEMVRLTDRPDGGVDVTRPDEPGEDPGFGPWSDPQDPALLKKVFVDDILVVEGAPT